MSERTVSERAVAGDQLAGEALNDAVSFLYLFASDCGKCCTGATDGDLCESCEEVREKIAVIILYTLAKSNVAGLLAALKRAHMCATWRDDGTCGGCFVSEAIAEAGR